MKTVFTTGEAAKVCKVSQQTIIRCFDNGQLKGFRVPGSRFRRIPREALYKFMKDNGIPTEALESGVIKELTEVIDRLLDYMLDGRMDEPHDKEAELIAWADEVTAKCQAPKLCVKCGEEMTVTGMGSWCPVCDADTKS